MYWLEFRLKNHILYYLAIFLYLNFSFLFVLGGWDFTARIAKKYAKGFISFSLLFFDSSFSVISFFVISSWTLRFLACLAVEVFYRKRHKEIRKGTRFLFSYFQFGGKAIRSLNIHRSKISEVESRNPDYYRRYKDNMIYENMVLDINDEISKILIDFQIGGIDE